MSEQNNQNGKPGPDFIAYSVKSYGQDQASWNRVGAAFKHRDNQGLDVVLDATPVDGRITLRQQRREDFKEQRKSQQNQRPQRSRNQGHNHGG